MFRSRKMAGSAQEVLDKAFPVAKNEKSSSVECAVCLQTCIHPAELPCGHIFCYLCIKGIVNQGRRCAMCRRDIPVDYLEKPRLLNPVDAEITSQGYEDGHLWFYEGHNGWWQYDERTSLELESAYQKGERCCELLIAGFLYVADFDEMLQYRRSDPNRRRRIKRDLATTNKKGVAGLKTTFTNPTSSNSIASGSNEINHLGSTSSATETAISHPIRTLASPNSNEFAEPVINLQRSRQRILLGLPPSTCPSLVLGNASSVTNNPATHSRNSNFENVIHETLDWTIEQIESLNLELLNDYEILARDANNYEQLQRNLNQNRSERRVSNYLSHYLSRNNPLRESIESESVRTCRVTDSSELDCENDHSEPPPVPTHDSLTTSETESNASVMPSDAESPPQPPPRGTSRRNFLRRSLSLNHEMYTSKFS